MPLLFGNLVLFVILFKLNKNFVIITLNMNTWCMWPYLVNMTLIFHVNIHHVSKSKCNITCIEYLSPDATFQGPRPCRKCGCGANP